MTTNYENIAEAVRTGEEDVVQKLVHQALDRGDSPQAILDEALISAMDEVGQLFEQEEIFLPELLVAANAMKAGVEILKPLLGEDAIKSYGTVIIGTVQGDLHDIGKSLVSMMLERGGFKIIDLGTDVSPENFIQSLKDNPETKVLGMSALLTTTMPEMKTTIEALEKAGLRDKVKVIIGGAPVTNAFAQEIAADAYAPDAVAAKNIVRQLVGEED
ncbi:MAG: corrinoid protein [Deltaproteobacteria bacterium]|nr:MAG: corrinoid protein [Deltaproteobacteria bacterium]